MPQKMNDSSPYASKIWLKSYDDHVKPELEVEVISLSDMMKNTIKQFPKSLCYDFQGVCVTYEEVEKYINSFSNFLAEHLEKGDRAMLVVRRQA